MANLRISELPAASAVAYTDLYPTSQDSTGPATGVTRKVTATQLFSLLVSPPAIGTTTPAAGKFTTLEGTGTVSMGTGLANYIVATGAATSGSYGTSSISTSGSATYSGLKLTTKGSTSPVGTDRPFIQSVHASFDANAAVRGTNTAFMLNNSYTYSSVALDPRFRVLGSLGGTITGSNFSVNEFTVSSDNTNATSSGGLSYLYVGASAGGTTFTGNRTGLTAKVFLNTASPNQVPFRFITGVSGGAYGHATQAGTGNNYNEQDGYIFGSLLQAKIYGDAHFHRQAAGLELNVGSVNPVMDVVGIQVVREIDAPNVGIRGGAAYGIVDGTSFPGTDGWNFGFTYMLTNGQFPLHPDIGTVLGAPQNQYTPAPETAYGVDFVGLTFGQAQFRGTDSSFMVDPAGNIGGQEVGGVALTTRSEITAATAVVNTITVVDGSLFLTKPALTVSAPPGSGTQATAAIDTMAADLFYALANGSGYVVGETVTLAGGTFTTAAVYQVDEVDGGVPTRISIVTPGSYTVLPASPVSTTASGAGAGLEVTPWWTALTVTVTNPGTNYPKLPLPNVTAAVTVPDGTMTPLRRMLFEVAMTETQAPLVLNQGSAVIFSREEVLATGTTQGTAAAIACDYVNVLTVIGQTGAILPAATIGMRKVIFVDGGATGQIYPATGEEIFYQGTGALGPNIPQAVPIGNAVCAECLADGIWLMYPIT